MRADVGAPRPVPLTGRSSGPSWRALLVGLVLGVLGSAFVGIAVLGPAIVGHRNDLPLERLYGDFAVGMAARLGAGNQSNPVADNRQALNAGRDAYTGSC